MGRPWRKERGVTLIELLVVVGMMGLVAAAIYTTYTANQKAAYSQGEVLEVQQNLRVALDYLTRDLKMAGVLIPPGTGAPIASASGTPPFPTYSTSIMINTASAAGRFARVEIDNPPDNNFAVSGTPDTITLSVEPPASATGPNVVDAFAPGDHVRLIRPFDASEPLGGTRTLVVDETAGNPDRGVFGTSFPSITIRKSDGSTFLADDVVNSGDLIAKVADSSVYPMTVAYYLVNGGVQVNDYRCPVNHKCLVRQVNGPSGPADIIATNISSLRFSYLHDGYAESRVPSDLERVRAVRITLQGTTTRTVASAGPRSRAVATVVKLRNRR